MFAEGYFTLSFAEILGLLVTVVSVYYVGRQLNEGKLASQMEGMLGLSQMESEKRREGQALESLVESDEWANLNGKEAYKTVFGDEELKLGYLGWAEVYELMGSLVIAKALDINVAFQVFGHGVPANWRRLEKLTNAVRTEHGELINENWEWLAHEFEKLD